MQGSLYGEECVFVANDWHAALLPVLLAAKYRTHGVYKAARSILAIHNLRHQAGVLTLTPDPFNPGLSTSSCWQGSSNVCGRRQTSIRKRKVRQRTHDLTVCTLTPRPITRLGCVRVKF